MEGWNIGIMEGWNNGILELWPPATNVCNVSGFSNPLVEDFMNPLFQHSNIPF
jgi:hypothetical protein